MKFNFKIDEDKSTNILFTQACKHFNKNLYSYFYMKKVLTFFPSAVYEKQNSFPSFQISSLVKTSNTAF
jgi:hypothetical protein